MAVQICSAAASDYSMWKFQYYYSLHAQHRTWKYNIFYFATKKLKYLRLFRSTNQIAWIHHATSSPLHHGLTYEESVSESKHCVGYRQRSKCIEMFSSLGLDRLDAILV